MPTISGIWKFNETVTKINNLGQAFIGVDDFTSNGVVYNAIRTNFDTFRFSETLQYGFHSEYDNTYTTVCVMKVGNSSLTLGWVDEAYRYIDFGTEPLEATEGFYAWLTENATYQAPEEPETPDEPQTAPHDFYIIKNGVGQKQDAYKRVNGQCVKQDEYIS